MAEWITHHLFTMCREPCPRSQCVHRLIITTSKPHRKPAAFDVPSILFELSKVKNLCCRQVTRISLRANVRVGATARAPPPKRDTSNSKINYKFILNYLFLKLKP